MKNHEYKQWLELLKYQANTITAQMHRAGRVEEFYGDLDSHFETDRLASVINALVYSNGAKVRGVLVASDFDSKAKAAARVIPNLALRKYGVRVEFTNGNQ